MAEQDCPASAKHVLEPLFDRHTENVQVFIAETARDKKTPCCCRAVFQYVVDARAMVCEVAWTDAYLSSATVWSASKATMLNAINEMAKNMAQERTSLNWC